MIAPVPVHCFSITFTVMWLIYVFSAEHASIILSLVNTFTHIEGGYLFMELLCRNKYSVIFLHISFYHRKHAIPSFYLNVLLIGSLEARDTLKNRKQQTQFD